MTDNGHTSHAGLLATAGPPIVHKGRTYRCAPLDQNKKAELERRLIGSAMSAAALAPEAVRTDVLAAVAAEAAGGAYGYYGAAHRRAMSTPSGIIVLASVLFGIDTDEAAELVNAQTDLVRAVVDLAVLESLPETVRVRELASRKKAKEEEALAQETQARPTEPALAS